jgi:predicted ATPase
MILQSTHLENFKAFGEKVFIPFAPITLIYGPNSSGKSTILQALNLLKQSRENPDNDALLLLRSKNGYSDLGSFQNLIFDHELQRSIGIRFDISSNRSSHECREICDSFGIEWLFRRDLESNQTALDEFRLCLDNFTTPLARYKITSASQGSDIELYSGNGYFDKGISHYPIDSFAQCTHISDEERHWNRAYQRFLATGNMALKTRSGFFNENDIARSLTITDLINLSKDHYLNRHVALDGFIPRFHQIADRKFSAYTSDLYILTGEFSCYVGKLIDSTLRSLCPLGPFRVPPSRFYVYSGTKPTSVGSQGAMVPDLLFKDEALIDEVNEWLKKLGIGYEVKVSPFSMRDSDLFELSLRDTVRQKEVEVGLSDVGFGISQVLPIIVQCIFGRNQIITVEQPEVHIHPRLQAELGDVFIKAVNEPQGNQVIVETHSEHLALRLQRRVREKTLRPEDVSILYVSRGPNGARVQRIRLDEDGDFMDRFPGGFFPERLDEIL